MKTNRGDVVLLDHPFSDASGSKVRPAVVVQADARSVKLTETIVALVTSNIKHAATDKTQVLVDISTPDGKSSGLRVISAVKCGKLFTVSDDRVAKKLGHLPKTLMLRVNDSLKEALEIP